ncbi:MAG: flavodoxin domain-containing protein [Thermoplasmata archaeon]|nr:flavodoxin domain-containing protein [Thermoplasmata archaeon]MBU1159324.1 flavodoxin domain-containing protein [Candidatus Thermoplasmatota archaeon]TFG70790.1 MAG: flavodoxin family protein [Methanomassiliicoccus sp.]
MARILICYYSRSGNTKKMAYLIQKGAMEEGVDVDTLDVKDVKIDSLLGYDGIILGSPTYYGLPSYQIKELIDKSNKLHGKLEGKVGGAFSSSTNIGGGNETTVLSILESLLIHGMVVCGDSSGDHYGPVSIEEPDSRVEIVCIRYGRRVATLTKRLHG